MGQAKIKQRTAFAPALVDEWEADDGVNYAVALARVTGWLLQVDWWVPTMDYDTEVPIEHFKPLRVYVADNGFRVFDVRGSRLLDDFNKRTIRPLAVRHGNGGVRTRYYRESDLSSLPLRTKPDATKIKAAQAAILSNDVLLASMPVRHPPLIPAADAAEYSYGRCGVYAQALHELTGLEPVTLHAVRFKPGSQGTRAGSDGYVHTIVLHPDGMAEDAWGKATIEEIADRFGVEQYRISREAHPRILDNLKRNSLDRFDESFVKAQQLIREHRHM